jgi:hypothetical protein
LSIKDAQARQVLFNVEVRPYYEAVEFHLSGDYYIEMREIYCPQGANCQWSPWKKVFSREISEKREWFANAQVRTDPFGSDQWWKLEREMGIPIPAPAPTPKG